jgi:hypothetical protein
MSGVPYDVYKKRVRRGWSIILAMTTPLPSSPSTPPPDLMYEIVPIIQSEFHTKAEKVTPIYNPITKVYERLQRTKAPMSRRWKGVNGFIHFVKDMSPRPKNTILARHDTNVPHGPNNSYWKKD